MRIPAQEIETAVTERIAQAFDEPVTLITDARLPIVIADFGSLREQANIAARAFRHKDHTIVQELLEQVIVHKDRVDVRCRATQIAALLGIKTSDDMSAIVSLTLDISLTRSGRAMRYVNKNGVSPAQKVQTPLIRLIVQSHNYWQMLQSEPINMTELAEREKVSRSWVIAVLRLAFLSPRVTDAIFFGTHNAKLDGKKLRAANAIDLRWHVQERTFCGDI